MGHVGVVGLFKRSVQGQLFVDQLDGSVFRTSAIAFAGTLVAGLDRLKSHLQALGHDPDIVLVLSAGIVAPLTLRTSFTVRHSLPPSNRLLMFMVFISNNHAKAPYFWGANA
jgi:hypothetical protein